MSTPARNNPFRTPWCIALLALVAGALAVSGDPHTPRYYIEGEIEAVDSALEAAFEPGYVLSGTLEWIPGAGGAPEPTGGAVADLLIDRNHVLQTAAGAAPQAPAFLQSLEDEAGENWTYMAVPLVVQFSISVLREEVWMELWLRDPGNRFAAALAGDAAPPSEFEGGLFRWSFLDPESGQYHSFTGRLSRFDEDPELGGVPAAAPPGYDDFAETVRRLDARLRASDEEARYWQGEALRFEALLAAERADRERERHAQEQEVQRLNAMHEHFEAALLEAHSAQQELYRALEEARREREELREQLEAAHASERPAVEGVGAPQPPDPEPETAKGEPVATATPDPGETRTGVQESDPPPADRPIRRTQWRRGPRL